MNHERHEEHERVDALALSAASDSLYFFGIRLLAATADDNGFFVLFVSFVVNNPG